MLIRGGIFSQRRLAQLKGFVSDSDKKPVLQIAGELIRCAIRDKEFPGHYFSRFAYRKDADNYLDYLSTKEALSLWGKLNSGGPAELLENKHCFQLFCEWCGLPVPRMLAYLARGMFFGPEGPVSTRTPGDLRARLLPFVGFGAIFVKPSRGIQGKNVFRFDQPALCDPDSSLKALTQLREHAEREVFIVQEEVKQHPEVAVFHPPSLNTVRMDTFRDSEGKAQVLSAFIRFGGSGRSVDNIAAGGCFVGIDLESGTLRSRGRNSLEFGAAVFAKHPTTGVAFEGRSVPHVDAAQELVCRAASLMPALSLIGWDVGIQADGPILIEGNHNYHVGRQDLAYGGYRRHPVIRGLLARQNGLVR